MADVATLEDLEARVAALEASQADYRAVLAAVNALGANQRDHSLPTTSVNTRLTSVDTRLTGVENSWPISAKSRTADFALSMSNSPGSRT